MAEDFNPYHVWLGIPLKDQPANYYRLLSLDLFETSGDVIDSAADRQMAHLRTFQSGKHGELTQRLLNEVAAARVCLLDPKKRAAYDQQLRAKLPPATPAAPAAASGSAIQRQPPRRPGPLPTVAPAPAPRVPAAAASPQPANDWDDLLGDPAAKSAGANATKKGAAKRAANNRNLSIGVGAAVLLIAAVGIGWFALNGSSSEGTLVFDWPADERADATVTVDDVPLPAPASGAWEYHGPAGSHHIVALRPAYKIDANVALAAGQKQSAPADWKPKAILVLTWPLSQRAGADLKIDGRTHAVTQHDPLEIAIEPGLHVIHITRPDSAPIDRSVTIAPEGRAQVAIALPPPSAAKLVFDWPADQRKDAALIIDGSKQTVPTGSDSATFALVVAPGRRVVHITRMGFEPFNTEIDLAAGANERVEPTWTPVQTVATTAPETTPADTQPAVETPAEQPAKKLPIPPAAEQEKVAKQLADLYKSTHSGSKYPAKAQELYDLAAKASAAERYVLLVKGAELAATAGDANLSLQGVDSLDGEFEIDVLEAKQKLLDKFVNAGKPEQVDAAIPIAEQLMGQAVAADRFALAIEYSMTASRAATKSKTPTRKEIDDRLSRRRHDIHVLEPFFAAAKAAQETLAKNPADAEANSNLGRWLCFYKADWSAGLPLLAKGSDEKLKPLAETELKAPTDAEQQAHLADAWWDLASKESGIARDSIHLHAGEIYQAASPNLTSALRKAAIEKRLAEIAELKSPTAKIVSAGPTQFPIGQWVDVLRLVNPTKNTVAGTWSRQRGEISVERGETSRIAIPADVEGGYDFEVNFTRTSGVDDVAVLLSVGSHPCMITISADHGDCSALQDIDGHSFKDSQNPIIVRPGNLENRRRYRLLVKARIVSGGHASVDVLLDGKPYLPHWEGDPASLSGDRSWAMPDTKRLGLAAQHCDVTFNSARLKMVSGHASTDASVAQSLAPQPDAAVAVGATPAGPAEFPLNQWIDVLKMVDTSTDAVGGSWSRNGSGITGESQGCGRIEIPVAVEGGYEIEVEFTRLTNDSDVNAIIAVGSRQCMVQLGANSGRSSGIDSIDGRNGWDHDNPTHVDSVRLENRHRYRLQIKVLNAKADHASVDVALDGVRCMPHWEGDPNAFALGSAWSLPHKNTAGLATFDDRVAFHSARLRLLSGHASFNGPIAEMPVQEPAPATVLSNMPAGAATFPMNQWVDILRPVDIARDRVSGNWRRNGADVACESAENGRLCLPVAIDGGYDLGVEFTRASGHDDIAMMLSVGSHACMASLSAYGGDFSGLMNVGGHDVHDPNDPIVVRPGTLENGRRYRLFISVRRLADDIASIDVLLDGKPYFPHWEGNPAALSERREWAMPKPGWLGLGAHHSDVTFHSVRLRMVSGHASLDPAVAESSAPGHAADSTAASKPEAKPAKGPQLQFTRWTYEADEEGRPGFFQKDDAGWTETKAGKVWSHYKETARTADYVEILDPARNVWVRLSWSDAKWSKNRSGWQLIGKGKPAAD